MLAGLLAGLPLPRLPARGLAGLRRCLLGQWTRAPALPIRLHG